MVSILLAPVLRGAALSPLKLTLPLLPTGSVLSLVQGNTILLYLRWVPFPSVLFLRNANDARGGSISLC